MRIIRTTRLKWGSVETILTQEITFIQAIKEIKASGIKMTRWQILSFLETNGRICSHAYDKYMRVEVDWRTPDLNVRRCAEIRQRQLQRYNKDRCDHDAWLARTDFYWPNHEQTK